MTTYEIDREAVWYLEKFDVQLKEWIPIHPYVEFTALHLARQARVDFKAKAPGVLVRLVQERRSRWVAEGDRKPNAM